LSKPALARITITNSRLDKYDRYLVDVWIPSTNGVSQEGSDDIYVNRLLLDEGFAQRAE